MITIISVVGCWLVCAIAAERAAEAVTASVFFSPLRQYLARTALTELFGTEPTGEVIYKGGLSSFWKSVCRWLSDLVSCGWCTSFWTSSFFSIFLPGGYFSIDAGNNILVKAIALWGFANLYHSVFRLVHNGRVAAIDVNLRLIDPNVDNPGGANGESGEGISQETTIGVEPPTV